MTGESNTKQKYYSVIFCLIILLHFLLLIKDVNKPFIGANEDDNALLGMGAYNQAKFGFFKLKFGLAPDYFDSYSEIGTQFYTNHPQLFAIPVAVMYKFFGVSEATTRLPSIILSLFSLAAFYYVIKIYYKDEKLALFSSLIYALLPGILHNSASLSINTSVLVFSNFMVLSFFLYIFNQTKIYKYLFFLSLIIGGFQGWHFYLAVAAVWLYSLINKKIYNRIFILIMLPLTSILTFAANFLHFFILRGKDYASIFDAFKNRTTRMPLEFFTQRYLDWFMNNFTGVAAFIALGFIVFCFYKFFKKRDFDLSFIYIINPFLVLIMFQQWSSHAFGPIFWGPFVALSAGFLLSKLISFKKIVLLPVGLAVLIFYVASVPGNLAIFKRPATMTEQDVQLLRDISKNIPPKAKIALGESYSGQMYGALFSWYLQRKLSGGWQSANANYIIGFNPSLGPSYQAQIQEMEKMGYKFLGSSGYLALLEKNSN